MSRDPEPLAAHRTARDAAAGAEPVTAVTDLLERVAAGDEAAFDALYDAVSGRVFGLARRITRDHALAEDVTQEVMVEVWRTAPRFDARRGGGVGWILMLTHRRAVDRVRRTTSRRAREARDGAVRRPEDPIDDELLRDEDRRQVTAALSGLTALQREAIRLAYYEGHTYREVARLLEIPEGTAKTRLRDGLRQLRASLRGTV